ncbi:PREDICTED: uncharacterized protein LOC108773680 isoform X2 [Cyphomyrmex costatus]|uniref:uncharacterized protein LOC108773680 isoform X2 n=1 Tax=Cyphomyrmex costatus TaxID=456900 RepID=UPI00085238F6|nr:PREDICTED: uncharacterized protein LOC108773680 isoform X2 [Cyphomyrmex costatus]
MMENESCADKNEEEKGPTRCFVCDADVKGRFYALATCRTQNSRTRVIEKLGELVGEGYMVVITEDDVICRSCGILVNTLDRLEIEMRKARNHILRFLEQKYSLNEGELRSSDKPKPCQPPQITRSGAKDIACNTKANETDSHSENTKLSKSHSWLQCDKCKYTTRLDSFMVYHLQNHIKEAIFCDNCGNTLEITKHNCSKANDLGNKKNETGDPTSSQEQMYVLQSIDITNTDNSKKLDSNLIEKTQVTPEKDTKHVLTVKDDGSLLMVEVPISYIPKTPSINSLTFK